MADLIKAFVMMALCFILLAVSTDYSRRTHHLTDIPYCYSMQHDVYLPCMYSSKEYRA